MAATAKGSVSTVTQYAAFAIGPIAFFDPGTGKQYFIPIDDITFTGSSATLNSQSLGSLYPDNQGWFAAAQSWIAYLASVGVIVPTTVPTTNS